MHLQCVPLGHFMKFSLLSLKFLLQSYFRLAAPQLHIGPLPLAGGTINRPQGWQVGRYTGQRRDIQLHCRPFWLSILADRSVELPWKL